MLNIYSVSVFSDDSEIQKNYEEQSKTTENKESEAHILLNKAYDERDISKKIEMYEKLLRNYADTKAMQGERFYYFQGWLQPLLKDKKNRELLIDYFNKNIESKVNDLVCFSIAKSYFLEGNLKETIKYFQILKSTFSTSPYNTFVPDKELEELINESKEVEIIEKQYEKIPDRKLWELGSLYTKIMKKYWNQREVGCDMEYPFTILKQLVSLYPKSEYSDNAEFLMLSYGEGISHEGGDTTYNLDYVGYYIYFTEKYPDSELLPEVYFKIGKLYFDFTVYPYGDAKTQFDEYSIENIKKAAGWFRKIQKNYPKSSYAKESDITLNKIEKIIIENQK